MRFADRITFVHITESVYDTTTGNYTDGKTTRKIVPCHIAKMGMERRTELFGNIDRQITQVTMRRPYNYPYTQVEYKGKLYETVGNSNYNKSALFVEGDLIGTI